MIAMLREQSGRISVGIHEEEGSQSEPNGATVAEIAEFHEFGLGVPRRSMIADWFDERREAFPAVIRVQLTEKLRSKRPPSDAFESVAVLFQASIQARFDTGIGEELSDETKRRKGSDLQLVDTGLLRSSVLGRYAGQ